MGDQTISKIEEQTYVANKILLANNQDKSLSPKFLITTTTLKFDRSKVLATISYDGNVYGEMLIFLLERNKEGKVSKHEFVGKAGFHVLGQLQSDKLQEFVLGEQENKTAYELTKMEISLKDIKGAIDRHLTHIQTKNLNMGQSK